MSNQTIEMLALNLKMLGRSSTKNILVSTGRPEDKKRLLSTMQKLSDDDSIRLFATPGTSAFLTERGIANTTLHKIADGHEPNIRSMLRQDKFDLVVNILTGNHDYDEQSDSNLIRTLCIQNQIPLVTDVDVSILTVDEMLAHKAEGSTPQHSAPWDMRQAFMAEVHARGGFCNHHAHFDKAYLINMENLRLGQVDMQKKWTLYRYLKENYAHDDLVERISRGVETMLAQGVTRCRSFIDADSLVGLKPIQAALEVRERYRDQITLEFAVQPLEGVLDPATREVYVEACKLADVVGGLPSRDRPRPEAHLDFIMGLAKDLNKPIDVHIDQENNPDERETELLALKTIEHGLHGRVRGVHAISLSAKHPIEQNRIIELIKEAQMQIIVCPSAALSMKQLDRAAPLHNSIAPVQRLLEQGVDVALGVDNIHDLFMPLVDGDM
ncbi:MAG: amidohydrolase family protein, partial [Myxococcota bacterium]